jgi:hypothetical protein
MIAEGPRMLRAFLTALTVLTVTLVAAPAGEGKVRKPAPNPNTPVKVTVLDGSSATLDLGNGTLRTAPLSGMVRGAISGGYLLSRSNTVTLRTARLGIGAAELVSDGCAPALVTTSPLTSAVLAPGRKATILIRRTGDVVVDAPLILRTVVDVRSAACGSPPATTGYADAPLAIRGGGKVVRGTGLTHLTLDSAPAPVTIQGCLTPGAPAAACSTAAVAYPVRLSTHLVVNLQIG